MVTENWRPIAGFEGSYEISDLGRVRSLDRAVKNSFPGTTRVVRGKVMALHLDKDGYHYVTLKQHGTEKKIKVHREVLLAFVGPAPEDNSQANHIDFCITNNSVGNLEWASPSENVRHSAKAGRLSWSLRGTRVTWRERRERRREQVA